MKMKINEVLGLKNRFKKMKNEVRNVYEDWKGRVVIEKTEGSKENVRKKKYEVRKVRKKKHEKRSSF